MLVNKNSLMLTSVVSAVPGAVLFVLMVLAFVNHAGGASFTLKALAGLMLLLGLFLAVLPVGILLSGPRAQKASKNRESAPDPADTQAAKVVAGEESSSAVASFEEESSFEIGETADSDDFTETLDATQDAGSDDFAIGEDFELDTDDGSGVKKKGK